MANGMSSASQSTLEGSTSGSHDNPEELNIEKKRKSSSVDPNSRPSKKKILDLVVPHVTPKWYELGVELLSEEQESQLDIIQSNYNDNKTCCREMFWYWLRSNPDANWHQLVECLKSPAVELHTLAADIETMYTGVNQTYKPQEIPVEQIPSSDFSEFENVGDAFVYLTSTVTEYFRKDKLKAMKRACITQTKNPSGAKLPPDIIQKIKTSKEVDDLLDVLAESPYWSWIDLQLLQTVVMASGSAPARILFSGYKKYLYSKKLIDILPNAPSREVKHEYYTRVVAKLEKDVEDITVADLLEFRSQLEVVIMDINNGTCVLDHFEDGCIKIHWFIPVVCVNHAYQTATCKRHKFQDFHLRYLQIGDHPPIYDPLTDKLPPAIFSQPPLPDTAETSKNIVDHFFHFMSHEMDADLIVQQMSMQRFLNDDDLGSIEMATDKYQKNCLVLEKVRLMDIASLMSFCELLKGIDHQRHIGTSLVYALQVFEFITLDTESENDQTIVIPAQVENSDSLHAGTSRKRPLSFEHSMPFKQFKSSEKEQLILKAPQSDTTSTSDAQKRTPRRHIFSEYLKSVSYFKPSSVNAEFLDMQYKLKCTLGSYGTKAMLLQCETLMASDTNNISLFCSDHLRKLKKCKFAPALIQKLSPYFNWSDHSVLAAVIGACNNSNAAKLLDQFDVQVDLSLPVMDYPIPLPSPNMIPYDTSSHTVLAVKLDIELKNFSLQNIFDVQLFLQDKFQLAPHAFQLLARSSTPIFYWRIPKSVVSIIFSNVAQCSDLHNRGIVELSVYPGLAFVTASSLKVGSLSFFTQIDHLQPTYDRNTLCSQLSNLEELPKMVVKLQAELLKEKMNAADIVELRHQTVQKNNVTEMDNKQLSPVAQKDPSSVIQESTSSPDPAVILKHVTSQKERLLAELKRCKADENLLQEQLNKTAQRYSDLRQQHDKLKEATNNSEIQVLLTNAQKKVEDVKMSCEKIHSIKLQILSELSSSSLGDAKALSLKDKAPFINQLEQLNEELDTIVGWMKHLEGLQTELTENKDKIEQLTLLNSEMKNDNAELKVKSKLTNEELTEVSSQLNMKVRELANLKEKNKLLVKQFHIRKETRRQQAVIIQEQLVQQETLGSGYFGIVHKFSDQNRSYAGKTVHKSLVPGFPNISTDQVNQFTKEIENKVAIFSYYMHPNIELFDASIQLGPDSPPTLLSELLAENLDTFTIRMEGKCAVHKQLELCHDMASGLQYLHSIDVVHHNLHGRNILISHEGKAKIADFVCSQLMSKRETMVSANVAYLPPEAIEDKSHYTQRSDVYSLGVLLLQVAMQRTPSPTEPTELSKLMKRKEELSGIKHHPLVPIILQCLSTIQLARPSTGKLCEAVAAAKESPQNVISTSLDCAALDTTQFSLALQSNKHQLKWTTCSPLPTAMYQAYGTIINNIMYIGGGVCPDPIKELTVYAYHLEEDKWSSLPPLQQTSGIPMNISDKLTVVGGWDSNTNKATSKLTTFIDNGWSNDIFPNLLIARMWPAVVSHQSYIIVAGGYKNDESLLDTIEVLDIITLQWRIVNTCLPKPMGAPFATICNELLVIVGFATIDEPRTNETFIIAFDEIISGPQKGEIPTSFADEENKKWNTLGVTPLWKTGILPGSSPPVLLGGCDKERNVVDAITLYDDVTKKWRRISSLPIGCAYPTVATIGRTIVVAGGCADVKTEESMDATSLTTVIMGHLEETD